MLKFLTGAAAIALAASAANADPGGGKGGGPDKGDNGGNGKAAHAQAGSGDGGGKGKFSVKEARGGDNGFKDRGPGKSDARYDDHGKKAAKADRDLAKRDGIDRLRDRDLDGRELGDRDRDDRGRFGLNDVIAGRSQGLIDGCPPGLAKKNNGCMPPGLARKAGGRAAFFDRPDWWGLNDRWNDNVNWNDGRYGYTDGYMVRYGDNGIQSWLPLLGGALSPGNVWPSQYQAVNLPGYYQDYYSLGASDGYRYYDDTLFRVDPQSQAITSIAALLTGNSINVGQRLPQGYDAYNVPYSYRDRYSDGPDANYRYSDGAIYQVDPTTQLVQAVIQLLT